MNIQKTEQFVKITPVEGKQLYNGEVFSECVYLPLSGDTSVWHDYDPETAPIELDRNLIVEWCKAHGFFETVMQIFSTDALAASWFYGDCSFLAGSQKAIYLQTKLGLNDDQLAGLLSYSRKIQ
jgi:hypothetical protein